VSVGSTSSYSLTISIPFDGTLSRDKVYVSLVLTASHAASEIQVIFQASVIQTGKDFL
jgi:hypothetical protein